MLPLVTIRLAVKAQVERMDRCLPQNEEKHLTLKNILEVAANCWKQTHSHTHMHMQTIVPSWFDVIHSFSFQEPNIYQYRFGLLKKIAAGLVPTHLCETLRTL